MLCPHSPSSTSPRSTTTRQDQRKPNIQVLVNLAALPVFPQQTPEDAHPPQPHDLGGHTGLGGTLSLTGTGVATETLGGVHVARTGARGGVGGLDDAELSVCAVVV